MEKLLSEITRKEWITYQWIDVTEMGDEGRVMLRGYRRTPDEAVQAQYDWDSTTEDVEEEDECTAT